jgi:hypothetical protein
LRPDYPFHNEQREVIFMKKFHFSSALMFFVMVAVAGCGGSQGDSGFLSGNGTTGTDTATESVARAEDTPLSSDGTPLPSDTTTTTDTSAAETAGTTTTGSGANSVTLAWDAPLKSDGTSLPNLAGYRIHYGTTPRSYSKTINNGMNTTCTIQGLTSGTYYFSVTCYDTFGKESTFSNEVSKTIQ